MSLIEMQFFRFQQLILVVLGLAFSSTAAAQCPPWKVTVTKLVIEIGDWRSDSYTIKMDFPPDFDDCLVDDMSKCWEIEEHTLSITEESPIAERLLALYVCVYRGVKHDFIVRDFALSTTDVPMSIPDGLYRDLLSHSLGMDVRSVLISSDYKLLTDLRFDPDYRDRSTIFSFDGEIVLRFF